MRQKPTQKTWTDRNIDLNKLKEELTTFLKDNLFNTQTHTMQNGIQITAQQSANYVFHGQVIITIQGQPQAFSIEITIEKKKPRFQMPIMLQTMLGGGILILQETREEEERTLFQKDFWDYTNKTITKLSGTANAPIDTKPD
jgi:hypothetical protein